MMMVIAKKKVRYITIFYNSNFSILEKTKKRKVTKEDLRENKDLGEEKDTRENKNPGEEKDTRENKNPGEEKDSREEKVTGEEKNIREEKSTKVKEDL